MANWEKFDDDAKKEKRMDVGFRINFITMNNLLIQMDEQTGSYDEKYPKSELLKLWFSCMFMEALLLSISESIILIITLPFAFFYLFVLKRIYKTWKRFEYKKSQFMLMTLIGLIVDLAVAYLVHVLVFWK